MKTTSFILALIISISIGKAQTNHQVSYFSLQDVKLLSSPFLQAQQTDLHYILALDPDRLSAPFLREAGLTPKAPSYTNWENTGLDGHIGGHYISALSMMYAATGDTTVYNRLNYMLNELHRAQQAVGNGFIGGTPGSLQLWKEIKEGSIRPESFSLNGKWVPLYNIHKTYAGLRDAYLYAGSDLARQMLIALTDWMAGITSGLTEQQMQDMLRSEHGGLNEIFADVADITGDKKYLELARRFSHKTLLEPLIGGEDHLTGMHANTQIPKVIGYKRIADLTQNDAWDQAARFFWNTVVNNRSVCIGGNSVREHFHPADNFTSMINDVQGPETCNTYNMLRLTKMLYETSADVHFMDYYERALYNHILSTQDPVQGGFVYFTPMRAGHYRVYSQPQTSFWCCVGSGMENHARYGEMIYGHKDNNLYVNLFIPSTLRWGDTQIEQQTAFPDEEGSTLVISPEKGKKEFTLLFRIPEWTKPEALRLSVNGKRQNVTVKEGYVSLNRTWSKGDKVRLELPMHLRAIALPDGSANYSILYGPIVLAARLGKQNQDGMFADDSRGGHIAAGPRLPLQTMPVIVGDKNNLLSHLKKVEGKPLTFTLSGVYPERYEGMTVEPFFRLYECRYMVYWPVLSVQELQARQEQLAKEEKERAALDGMTADKVICGEQQPESDHFIRMENSRTGDDEGIHWREAAGWFSYRMKTNGKQVNKVRIRFRSEIRKDAKVWINGQEVGRLAGKPVSDVSVGIFDVPASMQSNEQLEIKIGKGNEKVTPHIYEVRLVTE